MTPVGRVMAEVQGAPGAIHLRVRLECGYLLTIVTKERPWRRSTLVENVEGLGTNAQTLETASLAKPDERPSPSTPTENE